MPSKRPTMTMQEAIKQQNAEEVQALIDDAYYIIDEDLDLAEDMMHKADDIMDILVGAPAGQGGGGLQDEEPEDEFPHTRRMAEEEPEQD